MTQVIDLVDSIEYTTTNCFAHQLHAALHEVSPTIQTVALDDIENHPRPDRVICRLKQRTLCRCTDRLQRWLGDTPIVIFDQDPWEAFRDGSTFKGTYELAASRLNVLTFAVTTKRWADLVAERGLPSTFVRMWVQPRYVSRGPAYLDRPIEVGFVGALHPYRRQLFEQLEQMGTKVTVITGSSLPYPQYVEALSRLRVFIHCEDAPVVVDGREENLKDGLWIKDVEAAARGCFSVRNAGAGQDTYCAGVDTVLTYADVREVPALLRALSNMDPLERQATIDRSVGYIQWVNGWHETALALLATG